MRRAYKAERQARGPKRTEQKDQIARPRRAQPWERSELRLHQYYIIIAIINFQFIIVTSCNIHD